MKQSKFNEITLPSRDNQKELSLEEIDLMTRKMSKLHDEAVLRILARCGRWIKDLLHPRGAGINNKNKEFAEAKN